MIGLGRRISIGLAAGTFAMAGALHAADKPEVAAPKPAAAQPASGEDGDVGSGADVVTRHSGTFHGRAIKYSATAGRLPIMGPDGSVDAQMFFVAYTQDGAAPGTRPITFLVNGGPGAATAWLHLGGIGPRKVRLNPDGSVPAPPVRLTDNPDSILDRTDLVFIDAPGTGFSRLSGDAAKGRLLEKRGDLDAFASFVQTYLRKNGRFGSPLYLYGESYGSFRMAGLSDVLIRRGVPINGVVLLSSALDFATLQPTNINDLPYQLTLPSYASIAAFHNRLTPPRTDIDALRREAEEWTTNVYGPALAKGNKLLGAERQRIVDGLVRFTGLSPSVIETENLRIDVPQFMKYLQADRGLVTGRTDGRLVGPPPASAVEEPFYDPAMGDLTPAFTAAASQYLFGELRYDISLPYRMYSRDVATRFRFGRGDADAVVADSDRQTLTALQSTIVKNRNLKVLAIQGLYDLATPYMSVKYTLDHMPLPPDYAANVELLVVPAGHMAYDDARALREMNDATVRFIDASALGTR